MHPLLLDLWRGALDLAWPRTCLVCAAALAGTRSPWLCADCIRALPLFTAADALCADCAAPLGAGTAAGGCADCRRLRPRFAAVRAPGLYAGSLRRLLTGLKYARHRAAAWPLGRLMADSLRDWGPLPPEAPVVPFPSSVRALEERGFSPAADLAAEVARLTARPLLPELLERVAPGPPQASLSRTERLRAPRGTVRVRDAEAVRGRGVLLVDDVLTTGSSASEAARVLRSAGAHTVVVVVAARAGASPRVGSADVLRLPS